MKHKTKKRPVRNTDDISWGVSFRLRYEREKPLKVTQLKKSGALK